ncbi:MAG: hypothetical protein A3H70_05525 [Candidatus Komeilibacteria bacterium RIFCSPLOWO2_02_FULL_48_11]|uniref:Type II restriction endonuclease EcoO109IR domain-containing protein n=1 Tax=Candidatus Komeilibacteria bacterium RIFCSPLOWO2_02_FULL_48_11 TaxID=1798553 RepID=A0A1G2BX37_9BACT|nr:MAG: hypothetical protein A3H70_05525 [Candidatus Komeilibacteria bacterium RIFCSPLOWO2_02_FULL_48_11]
MKKINYSKLNKFITSDVVKPFYDKRIEKLTKTKLGAIVNRKNPYLFKAKNIQTAGDFAKDILDAFLSSQEETIFGDLLENLAIYVNKNIFNGHKAEEGKFKSVDLIFKRDNKLYIVGIKSGPNWGNSDQVSTMRKNFKKAREILKNESERREIIAVNGCMYGRDNAPLKKHKKDSELNYLKLCGQKFWEFVSGDKELYKKLIKPLDKEVKKRDDTFKELYAKKINEMTKDIIDLFHTKNSLDWNKIIEYVSKEK